MVHRDVCIGSLVSASYFKVFDLKVKHLVSQSDYQHMGLSNPSRTLLIHQIHVKLKHRDYSTMFL